MTRKVYRLLSLLVCVPAYAATIQYTDNGTFPSGIPSSPLGFTVPGAWSFSFEADTNPTPTDFGNGGFNFPFSNFTYTLGPPGTPPVDIQPSFIHFFSAPNGGGFEICFTPDVTTVAACMDGFGTPIFPPSIQMYSGTTSAPTLLTAQFTPAAFGVAVEGSGISLANTPITGALVQQGGTASAPFMLGTVGQPSVGAVAGTIAGQGSQDYYSFYWTGGSFTASASVTGAPSGASYLYSLGTPGTCNTFPVTLSSSNGFNGTISEPLTAGQYCIGFDANSANDPQFSLIFNTPVSGMPEPSTLLLFSAGIGVVTARRLAKRRMPLNYMNRH